MAVSRARLIAAFAAIYVFRGGTFLAILWAVALLLGFGLPGENAHAPDEWLSVENFDKGMRTAAVLWEELGRERKAL